MIAAPWLLLLHALATIYMAGLIWFVQVVHYPLFRAVGRDAFVAYEAAHTRLTTRVVAPAMLVEGATAGLVLLAAPRDPLVLAGLGLLAAIWLSTAFLQVPCHRRLSQAWDAAVAARLVRTNWIRTVAWSLRALLALRLLQLTSSTASP